MGGIAAIGMMLLVIVMRVVMRMMVMMVMMVLVHGTSAAVFTGINVVLAARRALPGTRVGEGSGLLVGRAAGSPRA